MTNDINLFYYGGSGGFFCLHLLLLTGEYRCKFSGQEQDIENILQKQWNINDHSKWKSHEIWPNNNITFASDLTNKIYFICNSKEMFEELPGRSVVLYTDIETQWFLARSKRAAWFNFNDPENHKFSFILGPNLFASSESDMEKFIKNKLIHYYSVIKADDWPECKNIGDFSFLPEYIKKECIDCWRFNKHWTFSNPTREQIFQTYQSLISVEYKDDKILEDLITQIDIEKASIAVKLQDLIKTKGKILFDQLGIKGNQKTSDFVDMWLSKHTDEQRSYLLK